ncbi:MAG: choline-responsive transcriptional repressor BetI [Rubrimonas sp.]
MRIKGDAETLRRREVIEAAITAIHARGSADVTVAEIARRAGCSAGLALHYFGGKEDILLAAMRHLLADFRCDAAAGLRRAPTPRARVTAVVQASFGPGQFRPEAVSAWLAFYAMAQRSRPARRLLQIYFARLRSNLIHALRPLTAQAADVAEGAGAIIDGLYLRHVLSDRPPDGVAAARTVENYVDSRLTGA